MNEEADGVGTVLVVITVIAALLAMGSTPSIDEYERNGTVTCRVVTGEIIYMEPPFELYVEVEDTIAGETDGYHVYVSPEVYANYSVGDKHEESICTFTDYEYFKNLIEQLKESGILN
tara:strand:+ start:745 stop:1098 length:354 start_codon:yes stop_codon:yes gene_type:complete